jgi:hypothetical protein
MSDQAQDANQPYEDPGWLPALKRIGVGRIRPSPKGQPNGVIITRVLFVSLLLFAFVILFVLSFIVERVGEPEGIALVAVVGLGLGGIAAAVWAAKRPLDVGSSTSLAKSYRENFFLGFALNEVPLFLSFAMCMIREEQWPYLLCFPFFALGMAVIAPSRRNLERRQQQIQHQGSSLSLGRALSHVPRTSEIPP